MNVDITEKSPRVLSLCSGYGGIELGLKRIFKSVEVVAYVEIEAFVIANLVDKMEKGQLVPAPVWTNVKTFRGEVFRGMVDILVGGYPCQNFSLAGKRKGKEDPRHLWPYFLRCIESVRPPMVFLENVEGHLSLGISEVLADLEEMGYDVEVGIFSAEEVGAPHRRKRVFILAHSRLFGSTQYGVEAAGIKQSGRELGNAQGDDERRESVSSMHRKGVSTGRSGNEALKHTSSRPGCRWPARPGEEQYDWEEPRTILADTSSCNDGKRHG